MHGRKRGEGRRLWATILLVTGVVMASVGCGGDGGGTASPSVSTPETSTSAEPSAPPTPTEIPAGFLLYEAEAAAKPYVGEDSSESGDLGWERDDTVTASWVARACEGDTPMPSDAGRVASRKLMNYVMGDGGFSEHLAIYRDETAARQVVSDFRAEYARCAVTEEYGQRITFTAAPVVLGDEALVLRRRGQTVDMSVAIVVRRGTAVAMYWQYASTDDTGVRNDAARMVGKLCRYDPDCTEGQ